MKLRLRERRLALVATIIIGCWGLLSLLVQPLWDRLRDLRLSRDTETERLQAFHRLISQASSIERDFERFGGYFASSDTEETPGAFLNELEALSRRANVQISFKPRPTTADGGFEVELDVEGSEQSLIGFLDELLRLPRLVAIERLQIASIPAKADVLRANLVLQRVILRR